eukprot:1196412-Prorocentrum_minimum.AAC.6
MTRSRMRKKTIRSHAPPPEPPVSVDLGGHMVPEIPTDLQNDARKSSQHRQIVIAEIFIHVPVGKFWIGIPRDLGLANPQADKPETFYLPPRARALKHLLHSTSKNVVRNFPFSGSGGNFQHAARAAPHSSRAVSARSDRRKPYHGARQSVWCRAITWVPFLSMWHNIRHDGRLNISSIDAHNT